MGTRQITDVLHAYADLLRGVGNTSADGVAALSNALSAVEEKKFKASVAKVAKSWDVQPEAARSTTGLSERLYALQRLLVAAGGKGAAEVAQLADLLVGRDLVEPAEFETTFREALLAQPVKVAKPKVAKPKKKKKPKLQKREPLTATEVRDWADRLTAASVDQATFENELAALVALPNLSVSELGAVAERYLGHGVPKGKPKILGAMRSRQKQDALEASRQGRISHIAV